MAGQLPSPIGLPWERWAAIASEQFAATECMAPVPDVYWVQWAQVFCGIPSVAAVGVPVPQGFNDWRVWAEKAYEALNAAL